jgi:hypothetical protein
LLFRTSFQSMSQKVIGRQGSGAFLVVLDDSLPPRSAIAVVVEGGRLRGGSAPLQSFLARGYWEEWSGTPNEAAAILGAIPARVPVAVSVAKPPI